MDPVLLRDSAQRLREVAEQIFKSSSALATDDDELLATTGAAEIGRLKIALSNFVELLPDFTVHAADMATPGLAETSAALLLSKSALGIVVADANRLQIMGRGFTGREEERLGLEQAARPHLEAAVEALSKTQV